MSEPRIAVYLSVMDWDAVTLCLKNQLLALEHVTSHYKVLPTIGANRVKHIVGEIEKRTAKTNGKPDAI